MEGFEKGLSSPSKSTGENNENLDSNHDKPNPKFHGQKKMVPKHFMSPTISASSKAAATRKKILAERNESRSPFDTQSRKKSNLDVKKSPRNSSVSPSSRIVSLYNHASKPNDEGDSNSVASPVQSYDPLKNYLSPRPKYLRFNPNRRLQILNRLEKEGRVFSFDSKEGVCGEEESSVEEIKDSSFSPSNESVVKNNENSESDDDEDGSISDEYEEEEDEEEEYEVEERGWCVGGVLRLVIVLLACLLSTSYICSMNSPAHCPAEEGAVWNLRDGYFMVTNQTLDVVTKMQDSGFLKVEDNYSESKEVEIDVGGIKGENEESFEEEMDEKMNENSKDKFKELGEGYIESKEVGKAVDDNNGENEERVMDEIDEAAEEVESEIDCKFEQVIAAKNNELRAEFSREDYGEYEEVGKDVDDNNGENEERVKDEIDEAAEKVESEIDGEFEQVIAAKNDELLVVESSNVKTIEVSESEAVGGVDNVESLHEFSGSIEKSNDVGRKLDETRYERPVELGLKYSTGFGVIVVVVSFILVGSVAIIRHHSKKSRNVKPHKFAAKEKKVSFSLPSSERKIEFFSRSSLPSTDGEASKRINNHHSNAPNVELIGEIDFSLRNRAKKEHMNQSEEKNASFSTTCFDSYGRFTTETMILKKEGGQSKEATVEVTPVRRSSRLRNRAAVTSS